MTSAIGDAKGVDLHKAGAADFDRVSGLGHDRVRCIVENRPFRPWDDLRKAGATLGSEHSPSR